MKESIPLSAVTRADAEPEIRAGQRFAFGRNWRQFLACVNEDRIAEAVRTMQEMLETDSLRGLRFVDIGCGSGLFSLAARRLGAAVHSFDFDADSVTCTQELRRRYAPDDVAWSIEKGSALDQSYLQSLGRFDVVYSWGVLHHTGDMWQALNNVAESVAPGGRLLIALYNDQGRLSKYWLWMKKAYNTAPGPIKWLVLLLGLLQIWGPPMLRDFAIGKPFRTWKTYGRTRGMSPLRDLVDWIGGYPFEVSKPEQVFDFYKKKGFGLRVLKTCAGRHGCNEYVFERS